MYIYVCVSYTIDILRVKNFAGPIQNWILSELHITAADTEKNGQIVG